MEESTDDVWRVTVEIPVGAVDDETRDRLFEAIADAAFDWESWRRTLSAKRQDWDIDVSASRVRGDR